MADRRDTDEVGVARPEGDAPLRNLLARRSVFDGSPLGIVEVDIDLTVLYANPAAMAMVGVSDYRDMSLDQVFRDPESRERLQQERSQRRNGLIGNYHLKATRVASGEVIPVEITAVPLADASGRVTGSIAVMRPERRHLAADIHRLNTTETENGNTLLARVAQRLRDYIPAIDLVVVTRYSEGQRHAHVFFAQFLESGRVPDRGKRWLLLTEPQLAWLHADDTRLVSDMNKLLLEEPWSSMRDEVFVKALVDAGMKSSVRRSIVRGKRLVASFSLLSRTAGGFTEAHRDLLDELPIEASVLQALEYLDKRDLRSRMKLVGDLNRCTSVESACKLLAQRLVQMFGWAHVSIFRVEHARGRIRALVEDFDPALNIRLEGPDYTQPIDVGILGRVVRDKGVENVGDVRRDPDYVRGVRAADVRSELCVPMSFEHNRTVRFIVNVEDTQENAFSEDEVTALVEIVSEVGALIQRISNLAFLSECFESSSDAVFVTDANFLIRKANRAAAQLLGYRDAHLLTGPFAALFDDEHAAARIEESREGDLGEWTLRRVGVVEGQPDEPAPTVPVYVVRKDLHDGLGGHIFMTRDLRQMRRDIELNLLEKTAYEVAAQAATPLTLVMAELELAGAPAGSHPGGFDNALRLLRQVQRSFAQLAMSNPAARPAQREQMMIDLCAEVRAAVQGLPDHLRRLVELATPDGVTAVRGDSFQLQFVLATLLAGLVRFASPSGAAAPVSVSLGGSEDEVVVRLVGRFPTAAAATEEERRRSAAEAERQIALPLVASFLDEHRAQLEMRELPGSRRELLLRFPAWRAW